MVTRTAICPVLQLRRLKLRMEETHVQGHTGPGVEPGFIAGVIDTEAQLSGHLSLLWPAQGPPDRARRLLRGTSQAGSLLHSTLLCHIALHLRATESQPPQAGMMGTSQTNPWEPTCKLGPRMAQDSPKVTQQIPAEPALEPRSLKPRAASLDLLRSTGPVLPSLY